MHLSMCILLSFEFNLSSLESSNQYQSVVKQQYISFKNVPTIWKHTFVLAFCLNWAEFEANRGRHMENVSPFASYRINITILYFESLSKKLLLYLSVFTIRTCTIICDHVRTEYKTFFIIHILSLSFYIIHIFVPPFGTRATITYTFLVFWFR